MTAQHDLRRILIIAGSDSGGGAGIQGDIKTVTCLGGYAMTAVTALTAQNTQGVFGIHPVPYDFIEQQIRLVLEDIGADCIKTGMLHDAGTIETVARVLADYPEIPLVLDPVMVAKGGSALLQTEALAALKEKLIPRALLITPNIPEAELLLGDGYKIDEHNMQGAAKSLLELGSKAVLLKGGHLKSNLISDILIDNSASWVIGSASVRIHTPHTHGTGCALASAIATHIAQGIDLIQAFELARKYVQQAIRTAPGLGKGHGPLNHMHILGHAQSSNKG